MRYFIPFICFTLFIAFPGHVKAQGDIVTKENLDKLAKITEYLGECSMIPTSMDRLSCFDKVVERFSITEPTSLYDIETPLEIGKWSIKEEPSDLDGNHVIFMSLEPESSIAINKRQRRPTLMIRCIADAREYTGSVYIVWDEIMGRNGKLYVKMRIDRDTPQGEYWDMSSDHKGSFHPYPFDLIKRMLNASVIRIDAQENGQKMLPTLIYDTRGFDNVVRTVKDTCNWG